MSIAKVIAAMLLAVGVGGAVWWNTPDTLDRPVVPSSGGLAFVAAPYAHADTWWVAWTNSPGGSAEVRARRKSASGWGTTQVLHSGGPPCRWLSGIPDIDNNEFLAWHVGDYTAGGSALDDTWGIYYSTRTGGAWTAPALLFACHTNVRNLTCYERQGRAAMVWQQSPDPPGTADSIMYSKRTAGVWSTPKCLLAGIGDSVSYTEPSLITGDTTDYIIAYTAWIHGTDPYVRTQALNDSLLPGVFEIAGYNPMLARNQHIEYLVWNQSGQLNVMGDTGHGWQLRVDFPGQPVSSRPRMMTDSYGWPWVMWYDSVGPTIMAAYSPILRWDWSRPETVWVSMRKCDAYPFSDLAGNIYCGWIHYDPAQAEHMVMVAKRPARPGVEEAPNAEVRAPNRGPTIVRGVLFRAEASGEMREARGELLDVSGRKVLDLHFGANDVGGLAPGVYFAWSEPSAVGRQPSAVTKVIIQR